MTIFQRLMSVFLIVFLVVGVYYTPTSAEAQYEIELLAVRVSKDSTEIIGRQYCARSAEVIVSFGDMTITAESTGNGLFSAAFSIGPGEYSAKISVAGTEMLNEVIDTSGLVRLFELSGAYTISGVELTEDAVTLSGKHSGTTGGEVAVKLLDNKGELACFNQETSADNNEFAITVEADPGSYEFWISASGTEKTSVDLTFGDFLNSISAGKDNYIDLLSKLKRYEQELAQLLKKCSLQNISTEYEKINYEIIKRYITFLETDAEHRTDQLLEPYGYELTRLYLEARDKLLDYLVYKSKPFSVPKYIAGPVRVDGKTVFARTSTETGIEERPVFFNGFGHGYETMNDMEFLNRIGLNITQNEVKAYETIVSDKFGAWMAGVVGLSKAELVQSTEESHSGNYSLKITQSNDAIYNTYREIYQTVELKPNTKYVMGVYAKGEVEKELWFNLFGRDTEGRFNIQASDNWTEFSREYTTGSEMISARPTIVTGGKTAGIYIDDIFLYEKGTQINLLSNGGFEEVPPELTELEKEAKQKGWTINRDTIERFRKYLADAERNNIMVDVGLSPHHLSWFIRAQDEASAKIDTNFMPFGVKSEIVREALDLFARLVASVVADYDSVKSICLVNESQVHSHADAEYYAPYWIEYLEKKYTTITALNEAYGTDEYTDFSAVPMPAVPLDSEGNPQENNYRPNKTPLDYDYVYFNQELLAEFHQFLATAVKKKNPDILVHAKIMQYFNKKQEYSLRNGANLSLLAPFMDLNGCDANARYENGSQSLIMLMGWYDYMLSIKEAPIWDTEPHIIDDGVEIVYDDIANDYLYAYIWNGAIHGRAANVMWSWMPGVEFETWDRSMFANSNFVYRPESVAVMAKANYDLNRLSCEVTALQNEKPRVGIVSSDASLCYTWEHADKTVSAYEEVIFNGQKAGFVTDDNPQDMHQYDLIIISGATHVKADMLDELYLYIQNGGKVLLTGGEWKTVSYIPYKREYSLLKYDELDNKHNEQTRNYIMNNAVIDVDISKMISSMGLSEITLIDTETGEAPENTEWSYTTYNDNYIINVMNYDRASDKSIMILLNGEEVTELSNLISGEIRSDFVAECYKPMLLSVPCPEYFTFDLINNEEVVEADIDRLMEGTIRCSTKADGIAGTMVLALYKNDVLIKLSIDDDSISFEADGAGDYKLMAAEWDMNTLKPFARCRKIIYRTEVE